MRRSLFLNPLYLDPEHIGDREQTRSIAASARLHASLSALRFAEQVDYRGVAAAKLPVLELLYSAFRERLIAGDSDEVRGFRAYQAREGEALRHHALFEALQEHFHGQDPNVWGWPVWPERYRHPDTPEVARFAEQHVPRVEFFEWLQWHADCQLGEAGQRAEELELGVGLYGDLAVSVDRGGAEAWAGQDTYALAATVGAPPDDFNLQGQNWGLPPLIPARLRRVGFAPFIATLRAAMRHVGALRVDHVMGLMRLFWIPAGASPAEGAYVSYPLQELLGILALESHRNRCLVVGEDLGTVPDEVRAALADLRALSYRLLYFSRSAGGEFTRPQDYSAQALVAVTTHDLPTLAGFWEGRDLALRCELGSFPSEEVKHSQIAERGRDRVRLLLALEREGLLPPGMSADPASAPVMTPELARAVHMYLARTPAALLMVQLEDVLGQVDQINLPGTTSEYGNWRRRISLSLERWNDDPRFVQLCDALAEIRDPIQG
jgi:(1->4)-alpha-D-glucan 1-alpha-D-glucosylmutase